MECKTYDLSVLATDPTGTINISENDKLLTIADMIVRAFRVRIQDEKLDEASLNFNRKIVKKIEKAEDKSQVSLKSKTIEAIKQRCSIVYYPAVYFQIAEIFDGEPTTAQLDEI